MVKTHLVEIFSSIQGEGPYIGVKQIFIRFAGCNLECKYCDTPTHPASEFKMEVTPGTGVFVSYKNPVTPSETVNVLNKLNPGSCHSISLTGGEPLLHAEFIGELAEIVKEKGIKLYLETNGTLTEELIKIINVVDIISMDIKLPSAAECGELWKVHEDFLKIGREKDIFVKTVVTSETSDEEFIKACETINKVDRNIQLIIQPVSSHSGFPDRKPSHRKILGFQETGLKYLNDVRIIPQTHKFMGLL